ncbi:MAG: UDP-2,3-diacylglucosamine diphosphatase LpxI [Alphaproteobacteria bacterium]|nr:UDP-2,3-diacylglucosamine diphosphatase LpxI [Alphaproteobacteria bacterium]
MTAGLPKLGIIAGAGELPLQIARACALASRPFHVVAVDEFANAMAANIPHTRVPISKIGACIAALKKNGCADVVFAGKLARPDGKGVKLRPDLGGLEFLARLLGKLGGSDDSLHRAISGMFGSRGFRIVSPLQAAPELAAQSGCLTQARPSEALQSTFGDALRSAKAHGATRQGQAVVVENTQIVAREARAGTDAMLLGLSAVARPNAMLVKAMAPNQLPTIDPPAIGESTVVNAAKVGLAGILIEAGRSVVVDVERVRARANELGIFVCAATVSDD